ncbi:MAG: hypothetical protein QMC09_03600, partial [Thauera sp.]
RSRLPALLQKTSRIAATTLCRSAGRRESGDEESAGAWTAARSRLPALLQKTSRIAATTPCRNVPISDG